MAMMGRHGFGTLGAATWSEIFQGIVPQAITSTFDILHDRYGNPNPGAYGHVGANAYTRFPPNVLTPASSDGMGLGIDPQTLLLFGGVIVVAILVSRS